MVKGGSLLWSRLESRCRDVFRIAGIGFAGYAGLKVTRLATSITVPDVVSVTIGHLGLLVLVFGLLGLYPRVSEAAPRLARAGAGMSILSALCSGILIVAVTHLTFTMTGYPAIPQDTARGLLPPFVGVVLLLVSILTLLLGFLLIGVAILQTDTVPRRIGYLLLVPSVMWTALFIMHAGGLDGTVSGVIVYVPIAAALVAIAFQLPSEDPAPEPGRSVADSTA